MPSLSSFGSLSTRLLGGVTPTISPTFQSRVIASYWNDDDAINRPIYYTDNYGNNWISTQFYQNESYDMASNGTGSILAVGGDGRSQQASTVLGTNNGNTWPRDTIHSNRGAAKGAIWNNVNNNFLFVIDGKVYSTTNGVSITLLTTLPTECKLSSNGSRVVAVGYQYSAFSDNGGFSWQGYTNSILTLPTQILFLNNRFILVDNTSNIKTSIDGITWTEQTSNLPNDIMSICWDGTYYVALTSNGRCIYSSDLSNWSLVPFPAVSLFTSQVGPVPKIVFNGQNYMFSNGGNSIISFDLISSSTVNTTVLPSPATLGYNNLLVITPNVPSNT